MIWIKSMGLSFSVLALLLLFGVCGAWASERIYNRWGGQAVFAFVFGVVWVYTTFLIHKLLRP